MTGRPNVQAWSGIVVDSRSGAVLWAKAADRRLEPASCAKIMTAMVVLEHFRDLTAYVRVPAGAYPRRVSIGLRPGERITLSEALTALMVHSANDAALTLAHAVAGNEQHFAVLMNRLARRMGLHDSRFVNSRGTPVPGQYMSARDLAVLSRRAMADPRFRSFAGIPTAVIRWPPAHAVDVSNHNQLLSRPWAHGIKTGATRSSGMVLAASGKPRLVPLIVVTMHEPSREQEVRDALALFAWGSSLYAKRPVVKAYEEVISRPGPGGTAVILSAASPLSAVVRRGAAVTRRLDVPRSFASAPSTGTDVGSVTYVSDGLTLGTVRLLVAGVTPSSPAP